MMRPARAPLVRAARGLREWRIAHEPRSMGRCAVCGDEVRLVADGERGRARKVHSTQAPWADCVAAAKVPPRWALWLFRVLRLSAALAVFERAVGPVVEGRCARCGELVGRCWCRSPAW
jgi:hypothetical protein